MVFNVTFNNISAISWRSVLLKEETRENHRSLLEPGKGIQMKIRLFLYLFNLFVCVYSMGRSDSMTAGFTKTSAVSVYYH
jgi:hypothetical protein